MKLSRQMQLGAFFVIVLGILGYYTLFMTDFSLFGKEHGATVFFPDANGLRQGDPVLIAGVRAGRVKTVVWDKRTPEISQRIIVTLKLDEPLELRQGAAISIADSTLLGGKYVVIDPGPPGAATIPTDLPLIGVVAKSPLSAVGDVIEENRAKVSSMITKLEAVIDDLQAGRGTFGRLLKDDELSQTVKDALEKFQRTADNLALLSDDLRAGKGTVGRLLTDEELSKKVGEVVDRLDRISADLTSVSKDLAEGKGTLGKLFKDEKLADDVAKAVESIRSAFDKLQNGEGAIASLINDPALAKDLKDALGKISKVADDLAAASDAIRNAKGTLGKFIMDDELYAQVQQVIRQVTGALEEYREAAPTTAFVSALFSLF